MGNQKAHSSFASRIVSERDNWVIEGLPSVSNRVQLASVEVSISTRFYNYKEIILAQFLMALNRMVLVYDCVCTIMP